MNRVTKKVRQGLVKTQPSLELSCLETKYILRPKPQPRQQVFPNLCVRRARKFTAAFRHSAVQIVLRDGKTVAAAARELDVNLKTYSNWVQAARSGLLEHIDTHRVNPVSELQSEVSRLRRALAEVTEERDILKKATAYFARVSK